MRKLKPASLAWLLIGSLVILYFGAIQLGAMSIPAHTTCAGMELIADGSLRQNGERPNAITRFAAHQKQCF